MKKSFFLTFVYFQIFFAFAQNKPLETGLWRATIQTQGGETPFQIEIKQEKNQYLAFLLNADERIKLDEIDLIGDSVVMKMHIFDAVLAGKISDFGKKIKGKWIKFGLKDPYLVPFEAEFGLKYRFKETDQKPEADYNGKWSVTFTDKNGRNNSAVGVFQQKNKRIIGTFLTKSGDYRYLEGIVEGKQMLLSTFDGEHGYLFKATQATDNQGFNGEFFAGKLGYEKFTAIKNDTASLPDEHKLTYLKPGYDKLSFSFPNLDNKKISLEDDKYKGKVVIVQILGTWCPNCMDETAFLAPWYKKNKNRGVEVIGLAYERSPLFEEAKVRIEKLKNRFNIDYEILFGGSNEKNAPSESLPMLNKVMAFPTTIIIDRQGKVRRIHTGFSGPGTGEYYEKFKLEFNQFITKLVNEKI
jgi:thiol-disulfide isomerase/thioredoxin